MQVTVGPPAVAGVPLIVAAVKTPTAGAAVSEAPAWQVPETLTCWPRAAAAGETVRPPVAPVCVPAFVQVTGADAALAGVAPAWVSVNVTWPAAWQVNVAWIVIVLVATPLTSADVVRVLAFCVKLVTVTPAAPDAAADVNPPA